MIIEENNNELKAELTEIESSLNQISGMTFQQIEDMVRTTFSNLTAGQQNLLVKHFKATLAMVKLIKIKFYKGN